MPAVNTCPPASSMHVVRCGLSVKSESADLPEVLTERAVFYLKWNLLFCHVGLSLTLDTYLFFGWKFKAMRKCSIMNSQDWGGENPKLGKQTLSKLNIETKPKEVDTKCKKTK